MTCRGDFNWNGFDHNSQMEMFEPSLLGHAVDSARHLDRRFGKPDTVTVSQRDVPGLTRASIPLLRRKGWFNMFSAA